MTQAPVHEERRKRPDLRLVFDDVIDRIAPYFCEDLDGHHTAMEFWAAREIQEMYPELPALDVQVLVNAAARYLKARKTTAGSGQARAA